MTPEKGPLGRRMVGAVMQKALGMSLGFEPHFIQELVVTHGLFAVQKWLPLSVRIMEDVQEHFGVKQGQLLLAFAATWLGCGFCSRGHLFASNLHRFDEDGTLYPLQRHDILELQNLADEVLMDELARLLTDFPEDVALIRRQNELRLGAEPENDDDRMMMATLAVWEWITDCSIPAGNPEDVEPLESSAVRNKALRKRYQEARESAG